jgi:hypothetical protein
MFAGDSWAWALLYRKGGDAVPLIDIHSISCAAFGLAR